MITNDQLTSALRGNPILIGCIAVSIILGAAIYYRSDSIPHSQAALEQKSTEGRRLAQNLRNAGQLSEQTTAITSALVNIDERIIRRDELAKNLQYFYRLESETGVKLVDLRQGTGVSASAPAAKSTGFVPVMFNISVQGDFKTMVGFLRRLEAGSSYSRIVQASAAPNSTDRSGPFIMQLTLEVLGQP